MLASTPVLTRLFSPDDFGVLAVYASLTGLVGVVAALRYELAIPVAESDAQATTLGLLGIVITLATSLVVWGLLVVTGDTLLRWFQMEALAPYLWMVPVGIALVGTYQVLSFWSVRDGTFATQARTKLLQGGGQAGVQLAAGVLSTGAVGLLVGDVMGRSLGITNLAREVWTRHHERIRRVQVANLWEEACRFWRFPVFSGSASILNSAGLRMPALLLAAQFGPAVAGWFAISQRVLGAPMALVGQAVSRVYLGDLARLRREEPAKMPGLYRRWSLRLLLLGAVPSLLLALAAPWAFGVAFGPEWIEAGLYTRLLALMLGVQFVVSPLSQTLIVLDRQNLQLVWDGVRTTLIAGVFVGSALYDLSALQVVGAYSLAMAATYALLWIVSMQLLARIGPSRIGVTSEVGIDE